MTESPYFQQRQTRSKLALGGKPTTTSDDKLTEECSVSSVSNVLKKNNKRKPKLTKVTIKYENEISVKTEPTDDYVTDNKKIKHEPTMWKQQLDNIYEMRKLRDAPVDSMGCDVISDKNASPEVSIS